MNNLESTIHKQQWKALSEAREDEEIVREIFAKQRESLIQVYAGYMRANHAVRNYNAEVEFYNRIFPGTPKAQLPATIPARDWCSAAILILTHGTEELQKMFISSPFSTAFTAEKDKLVQAVIDDGGLWCAEGSWSEIPE